MPRGERRGASGGRAAAAGAPGTAQGKRGGGCGGGSGHGGGRGGGGRGAEKGAGRRRRDGSRRLEATGALPVAPAPELSLSEPATKAAPPAATVQIAGGAATAVARLADPGECAGCGICVNVCPRSAIELDDVAVIREDLCTGCGECVEACPRSALKLVTE